MMMSVKSCRVSLLGSVFNNRSVTELMEETPQLSGAQPSFKINTCMYVDYLRILQNILTGGSAMISIDSKHFTNYLQLFHTLV